MKNGSVTVRRLWPLRLKWLLGVVMTAAVITLAWFSPGVSVIIRNSAAVPIRDVQLKFKGGAKRFPPIPPNHSVQLRVNPTGESNLELEFVQGTDHRRQVVDVYIEHDYAGEVYLTVGQAGEVRVRDKIRLRWYLPTAKERP